METTILILLGTAVQHTLKGTNPVCIPNWVYNLAGGLTGPLPLSGLSPGRYRLTVYAWDWSGNRSALDDWIHLRLATAASAFGAPSAEFGPLNPNFEP